MVLKPNEYSLIVNPLPLFFLMLGRAKHAVFPLWILICTINAARAWQSDNGDGSYTNPVLYADYSDPDIIRVGSDFYMVSSSFTASPGLTVLKSKDMVNWEFAGHAADPVGTSDAHNMINGQTAYEGGFWAPSIRHHNGVFYIAVQPTFDNGRIYYATDPAGPWSFHQLDRSIYDPGLFFDDNGTGYIISGHGPQSLMVLNPNYSAVVQQIDNYLNSGGEGTHVVKRGAYYYAFNANPGVWPFQLRCSRTQNIVNGPWETGHVCLTAVTGGHQGSIVDVNDSDQWFGFVHQDSGAVGRMPRIGPVFWENDWPVFGTPADRDNMAAIYQKPVAGQAVKVPATSDDFSGPALGLQWQWNHNPDAARWSLTERPGFLRLRPGQASEFWKARNTLTQKAQGPRSQGVVKLDLTNLQPGDTAGFGTLGKISAHLAIELDALGNKTLGMRMRNDKVGGYTAASGVPVSGNTLYLRTDLDFTRNLGICAYSADGANWTTLGGNFPLMFGFGSTWQGEQFAFFCYNPNNSSGAGYVDVDSFTFTTLDDNADLVNPQRGRAKLNAARTTFVADNGQLLRGPYESTEWTTAAPEGEVARIKELGFNSVHLYAETFDPNYPNAGSTAPGYALTEIDKFVQMTRDLGLYLVITIGNGGNNGKHNKQWAVDFWNHYAPRYADETHVLYEIHNEPVAWGPSYHTATTPTGALDMEVEAYQAIRSHAPHTPVLLFTYAVLGGAGGRDAALTDIKEFNQRVFGNPSAVWTNEAVGFHGYGGWKGSSEAVAGLLAAGHPCMMTEFGGVDWGGGVGLDVELTSELERLGVSWLTFQYIPPAGVSDDVTRPEHYKDLVDRAGLSWTPDYGNWPIARGPYGSGGQPRHTTSDWTGDFLTGTVRIEAEDFDAGGQGVAVNDIDAANHGGQYRPADRVDIEATADTGGGFNVGWTGTGEWMEYTIWIEEPGYYDVGLRIASVSEGGVRLDFNGADKTGTWTLPNTGGWQTWTTVSRQVFLEFGRQKLRIHFTSGAPNLNWIELAPSAAGPVPNGIYKLVNRNSGMSMEYDTTAGNVIQQADSGAAVQQWNLQHLGAGQYRISSVHNNDKWTSGGLPNDKVGLVWWWGADANWQRFVIRPAADGFHRIAAASFGLELESQGGVTGGGAPVTTTGLAGYTGTPGQQWALLDPAGVGIPTALVATAGTGGVVSLVWNAVSGATGYVVKRSTTSGGPYAVIASGITPAAFTDVTAQQGVVYHYVVSALNGSAEGLHSAEASSAGPSLYLKMDENTGLLANDASGNGWNGSLVNGVAWGQGKFASGVDLDGFDDHLTLPAGVVSGLTDCTFACWVNFDAVSTWSRVFDFGTGTGSYLFLTPSNSWTGTVRFGITSGSGEQVIDGAAPLPSGQWVHVAVTMADGTGTLYVNGVETGRNEHMTLTPASLGVTNQNYLGKSQWADPHLSGRLDEFRIYPVALTPAGVAALHAQVPVSVVPPAPVGLAASAGASGISLEWQAASTATGYRIKRSTASGGPYDVVQNVTTLNFTDSGVVPGSTYHYVVSAINGAGESADSTEASATVNVTLSAGFVSVAAQDGYVTGTNANTAGGAVSTSSGTLRTGDGTGNQQYKTVVSFDTSPLPDDAVILSATLKLKRASLSGTNPFTTHGLCHVDVKRGAFSGNLALENSDFETQAHAYQIAAMDDPAANAAWSSGELNATGRAHIHRAGTTQFRVYFNNATDGDGVRDTVNWYSGDDAGGANRPVLDIIYQLASGSGNQPLVWLKMDESAGALAADSSGNGWHGALANGPAWTAGIEGDAIHCDGFDDHLTLPSGVVAALGDFTVSTWVKLDSLTTWARVFDFGTGMDNYMFLAPMGPAGSPRFAIRTPLTGEQVVDGNTPFPIGQWTHVAVSLSVSTTTLYLNGAAVGVNANNSLTPASMGGTTANFIGKSQWPDPYLHGAVDDFRIYGTALAAEEILTLATRTPPIGSDELQGPAFSLSPGVIQLATTTSVPGHFYQVEVSPDLSAGSWQEIGAVQGGSGAALIFDLPRDPSAERRFYRIRISAP